MRKPSRHGCMVIVSAAEIVIMSAAGRFGRRGPALNRGKHHAQDDKAGRGARRCRLRLRHARHRDRSADFFEGTDAGFPAAEGDPAVLPEDAKLMKVFDEGCALTEGVAAGHDGFMYFSDITFTGAVQGRIRQVPAGRQHLQI